MANSSLFRTIVGPVVQEQEEDETPVLYRRDSPLLHPQPLPAETVPPPEPDLQQ